MVKILIIGGPRTGKTTKAKETGQPVISTDALIAYFEWGRMSDKVLEWLEQPGPWAIEGCAGVRGLRKWLAKYPGLPDFEIVYLSVPHVSRTPGQVTMAKGVDTMWRECQAEIAKRNKPLPPPKVIRGYADK